MPPELFGLLLSPSSGRLGVSGEKLLLARALSQVFGAVAVEYDGVLLESPSLMVVVYSPVY